MEGSNSKEKSETPFLDRLHDYVNRESGGDSVTDPWKRRENFLGKDRVYQEGEAFRKSMQQPFKTKPQEMEWYLKNSGPLSIGNSKHVDLDIRERYILQRSHDKKLIDKIKPSRYGQLPDTIETNVLEQVEKDFTFLYRPTLDIYKDISIIHAKVLDANNRNSDERKIRKELKQLF